VALVLAASFLIDGIGKLIAAVRAKLAGTAWAGLLIAALMNIAIGLMLATRWPVSGWHCGWPAPGDVRLVNVAWP
jgi:hypothetical protein